MESMIRCDECDRIQPEDHPDWTQELIGAKLCYPSIPIWRILCGDCR